MRTHTVISGNQRTYLEWGLVQVGRALGSQQVQVWRQEQIQEVPVVLEEQGQAPPRPSFQLVLAVPVQT